MNEEHIDQVDWDILYDLRKNARMTHFDLSEKLGISVEEVNQRIKKMEDIGLILGYTVVPNFKKLTNRITIFVGITRDENSGVDDLTLAEKLTNLPDVTEVYNLVGEFDILMKARLSNIDDLSSVFINRVQRVKGVRRCVIWVTHHTAMEELGTTAFNFSRF
ncbi:MAG: Lrp/AsnC family transcriptional regulator [Candidatus Heimdallarchaeota archaeon]|nr:Lrp/AsnC family transcriptional regulator [Candidatus Heimdallarchaeota archaeon]